MKLYLVEGFSINYSEQSSWIIGAYTDKEVADQHCQLAQDFVKNVSHSNDYETEYNEWMKIIKSNPYDRANTSEEFPVLYRVIETKLYRHVDEYQELT